MLFKSNLRGVIAGPEPDRAGLGDAAAGGFDADWEPEVLKGGLFIIFSLPEKGGGAGATGGFLTGTGAPPEGDEAGLAGAGFSEGTELPVCLE